MQTINLLIENPRNFFNLDRKTVFNNLCPVQKTYVWDFVDSIPKCVSVNDPTLLILNYTIK